MGNPVGAAIEPEHVLLGAGGATQPRHAQRRGIAKVR